MFWTMTFEAEQFYLFGIIPCDGTFVAACIAGRASLRKLAKEDEAKEEDGDLAQLVVARFPATWKG